jgi:FixJ family two-component response regulator
MPTSPSSTWVDDDEAIRRSAGFMLKTSGFSVRTYESGVELLKQVRSLEPGCILLDIRMPGMDGLDVQQALREQGVALPVVIMTGHGDVSLAVRAMKAGAVDFIEKPFEKAGLLAALEIGRARLEEAERSRERAGEAALRLQALTSARARRARRPGAGPSEQEHRLRSRDQPPHGRNPPRQSHDQARRPQPFRSPAHRLCRPGGQGRALSFGRVRIPLSVRVGNG